MKFARSHWLALARIDIVLWAELAKNGALDAECTHTQRSWPKLWWLAVSFNERIRAIEREREKESKRRNCGQALFNNIYPRRKLKLKSIHIILCNPCNKQKKAETLGGIHSNIVTFKIMNKKVMIAWVWSRARSNHWTIWFQVHIFRKIKGNVRYVMHHWMYTTCIVEYMCAHWPFARFYSACIHNIYATRSKTPN